MFTYIYLGTHDLTRAARFYDATMATLGHSRCDVSGEPTWEGSIGWGIYERSWHDGVGTLAGQAL